jgi:hypothetical protein
MTTPSCGGAVLIGIVIGDDNGPRCPDGKEIRVHD